MFIINQFLSRTSLGGIPNDQEERENDQENSTLLKVAACIPALGLFILNKATKSINGKLRKLPLPSELRPNPMMGKILDENASSEEIKAACERAVQLKLIERDYTKAALVNNILTIALAVYALAINVIPFVVGAFLIGGFSLTAAVYTFSLYVDDSIKCYETVGANA